jgi:amino-acid N-acetyltransferase
MAILHAMGIKLVLVHGFRPNVDVQLRAKGHGWKFSCGRRVTDSAALDCARKAAEELQC